MLITQIIGLKDSTHVRRQLMIWKVGKKGKLSRPKQREKNKWKLQTKK